jgi:hypothetical protein
LRNLTPEELQRLLPKLRPENFAAVSHATPRYNCVAFANEDERHWWEPGMHGGKYYWPTGKTHDTIESWREIFEKEGYEETDNRDIEPGFEKVAIYVDLKDFLPSHVAKSDGRIWKSKLGKGQDIEHASLDLLEGDQFDEYGVVDVVLKRAIR